MPVVWIPTQLRDLTHGQQSVSVTGDNVRAAINQLELQFPGISERLCEGDKIRPNISVLVDGHVTPLKIRERLQETSEVHFVVRISGGSFGENRSGIWGREGKGGGLSHLPAKHGFF